MLVRMFIGLSQPWNVSIYFYVGEFSNFWSGGVRLVFQNLPVIFPGILKNVTAHYIATGVVWDSKGTPE